MPEQLTNYQCPNCNGPLRFDPVSSKLKCDSCGSTFTVDEIDKVFFENALFKDLVDICKNAIVILSISSVKINRHWQFNDISAYEWYLFHH